VPIRVKMKITPHRAFSLAIASLGDSARVLDSCGPNGEDFAQEIRAARDYLTGLRDQQPEQRLEPSTPNAK
jgi:hypothetical protein